MTKELLAQLLHSEGETDKNLKAAKDAGLFVIYGASDDIVCVEGMCSEELDAYDELTFVFIKHDFKYVPVDVDTLSERDFEEDEDMESMDSDEQISSEIHAEYTAKGLWAFKTTIPHATYRMLDNYGDNFGTGIVIDLQDLIKI